MSTVDRPAADHCIVVETENVAMMGSAHLQEVLDALAEQIDEVGRVTEVLVYVDGEGERAHLEPFVDRSGLRESQHGHVRVVTDGPAGYYEMKNDAVRRTTASHLLFVDSDTPPCDGWLAAMIGALDAGHPVVTGNTAIRLDGAFWSRTVALIWNFPLPARDREPALTRDRFYANNFGVRRHVLQTSPFPDDRRTRGQCATWRDARVEEGTGVWWVPLAEVRHAPYPRIGFLRRGVWAGRDRALSVQQGSRRLPAGQLGALRILAADVRGRGRRIVQGRAAVGLPGWQVPAAAMVAIAYSVATYVGHALTLADDHVIERRVAAAH